MKTIYLSIIITLLFACKPETRNNEILNKTTQFDSLDKKPLNITLNDSIQIKPTDIDSIKYLKSKKGVFVDLLKRYYGQNDYYVSLCIKEYSEDIQDILEHYKLNVIEINELETRTILSDSIVKKYFQTEGLDSLLVIDKNQKIVDTIYRKNYEEYDAAVEWSYTSSYSAKRNMDLNNLVGISMNGISKLEFKKAPEFWTDSTFVKEFSEEKFIKGKKTNYFSQFHLKDTIVSLVSVSDYKNMTGSMYLMKNEILMDSINENIAFNKLYPIPIVNKNYIYYITDCYIPDSDAFWNSLIRIDTKNWTFKFLTNNRINSDTNDTH